MSAFAHHPWIPATAVVYLVATLGIGVWALRRTRGAADFFVAGRGVGVVAAGLATMAAAFSGFVFLGGPGFTYRIGLAALLINVPVSFTGALLAWVIGKRLRLLAEVREVFTVPDAFRVRFGSRAAGGVAAVAVLVGSIGYLGAQILALGVLGENLFGTRALLGAWSLPVVMAVGAVLLTSYCVAGGMVAGVYTDVFQGAVMVVAATAVFAQCLRVGGGLGAMARTIAASPRFGSGFLDPLGGAGAAAAFGFFFVFGLGVLGQPHMVHKFLMLRDPERLRFLPLVLGVAQSLCLLIWLGIGLAVPALVAAGTMPPLAQPDDAAPAFLLGFAPQWLAGVVFAGALAAIMSTASSLLNLGAAALVRDLPRARGRRVSDELRAGRWATVALAVVATLVAWAYGDLIALLGTFAFGTFAAALGPALAVGLNWRRVTARAATASVVVGLVVNLGLELVQRSRLALPGLSRGVPASAVALAASFIALFLATALDRRAVALPADVAAVLEV